MAISVDSSSRARNLALLIDGDNAQPSLIPYILAETAKYGAITVRRIYGDWTTPRMSGWKVSLHTHAVQPMQQFRYTTGKNATDSALIIEAMDLLHSGTVSGFSIVSSDSDYTRLATRVRDHGLFVMGIGRSQTPKSFVNACEVFVYTQNLVPEDRPQVADERPSGDSDWIQTVTRAIEMALQDDGWAFLGAVGTHVRQLDPAFGPRSFGYKQLSLLIKSRADRFKTRKAKTETGPSNIYVKLAD